MPSEIVPIDAFRRKERYPAVRIHQQCLSLDPLLLDK